MIERVDLRRLKAGLPKQLFWRNGFFPLTQHVKQIIGRYAERADPQYAGAVRASLALAQGEFS